MSAGAAAAMHGFLGSIANMYNKTFRHVYDVLGLFKEGLELGGI